MSETRQARKFFEPWTSQGFGVDVGFGGDPVTNSCLRVDLPAQYTNVGNYQAHIRCHCKNLHHFLEYGSVDWIYSSHLLEDFTYKSLFEQIIPRWLAILRPNGYLLVWCPDQQAYLDHAAKIGKLHAVNKAHKEQDFSRDNFIEKVVNPLGELSVVSTTASVAEWTRYSWGAVFKKDAK